MHVFNVPLIIVVYISSKWFIINYVVFSIIILLNVSFHEFSLVVEACHSCKLMVGPYSYPLFVQ